MSAQRHQRRSRGNSTRPPSYPQTQIAGGRPLTSALDPLDFTWVRAGPWATRWLALLGAEVLKVEWPDPRLGAFTGRLPLARPGTTPEGITPGINSNGHFSDQNAHNDTFRFPSAKSRVTCERHHLRLDGRAVMGPSVHPG